MNTTTCLKIVKVVGIIDIIYGGLAILTAIIGAFGSFAMLSMTAEELAEAGLAIEGTDISASTVFVILAVTSLVEGVLMVCCGIFGLKATSDPAKVKPLWVVSLILVAIAGLSLVFDVFGGMSNVVTELVALALTGAMFYAANVLKQQGTEAWA